MMCGRQVRRWRVFAAAIFVASVATPVADADPPETLKVLNSCPPAATDWGARVPVTLYVYNDPGRVTFKQFKAPATDNPYRDKVRQAAMLEGILNGGTSASYRLEFPARDTNDVNDNPSEDLQALAYLGRSERNRPVILTDRGPLEISTPSIDQAVIPEIVLAREKTMTAVARYYSTDYASFVVTKSREVGAWDAARHVCVTAPRRVPGMLVIMTHACRAAGPGGEGAEIPGNTATAPDLDIAPHIRKLYREGLEPDSYTVNRVPHTGLIIIKSNWSDCC